MTSQHDFQGDIDAIAANNAVPTLLETVCLATGMRFAAVARVTEGRWITCSSVDRLAFGLTPGDELEVESTLCHEVRLSDREIVIPDVAADPQYCGHHTPARYGFRSYVSVPVRRRDGSFFGTLCAIDPEPRPVDDPRILAMFRLFAQSIGDSLEAAEKLERTEDALALEHRLMETQEEFTAILGHDLRNPVAALHAGLRMLGRRSGDPEILALLAQMKASVFRMDRLIENLLDHSRLKLGGSIGVTRRPTHDLGRQIEHVVAELATIHPERPLLPRIALSGPVTCDPDRLGQMLSNLLANAISHGDEGTPVEIAADNGDGALSISVTNRGAPIPEATRETLFQPFVHRATPSARGGGFGLGLYIAAEIARAHGGRLDVVSDPAGTTFTFHMPPEGAAA